MPDLARVLCDGPIARELPGAGHVYDGLARPFRLVGVQGEQASICLEVRGEVRQVHVAVRTRQEGLPQGLAVTGAIPGTPAARSGVEPGAMLVAVDGRPVSSTLESFCAAIQGRRTGEEVALSFGRAGTDRTETVRLTLA